MRALSGRLNPAAVGRCAPDAHLRGHKCIFRSVARAGGRLAEGPQAAGFSLPQNPDALILRESFPLDKLRAARHNPLRGEMPLIRLTIRESVVVALITVEYSDARIGSIHYQPVSARSGRGVYRAAPGSGALS